MVNFVHRITAELLGLLLLAAIYRVAGLLRWPLTQVSLYICICIIIYTLTYVTGLTDVGNIRLPAVCYPP